MNNKMYSDAFIVTQKDNEYNLIEESILNQYATKSTRDLNSQAKQLDPEDPDYAQLKQPLYNFDDLAALLEVNTFHKLCCEVVAEDSSGYGWNIIPTADDDLDNNPEEKEYLTEWVKNFTTPINQTLYQLNYDRRALGCGAVEIIRESTSSSPIIDIKHIPLHQVYKHSDNCRIKQIVGAKHRWFIEYGTNFDKQGNEYDVNYLTGEIAPWDSLSADERANEIIWFTDYAPQRKTYGLPKIAPAIKVISGDLSRSSYNTAFFKNYGMPTFAVTVTGDFWDYDVDPDDPEYDVTQTLKYKISQQLKEVIKNPHSAVTITVPSAGDEGNVDVNIQPLSVDTKEASFRMYRADNRDEILAAHGVPPYRLGLAITGSLGGNVATESSSIYNISVIQPLKNENENLINTLIRKELEITDWKFSINEIDKRDTDKDLDRASKLFDMGAITPRELIEYFGKPFGAVADEYDTMLDEHFVHGNPLSQLLGYDSSMSNMNDNFLDNLRDSLLNDAQQLNPEDNGEGGDVVDDSADKSKQDNNDGIEGRQSKTTAEHINQTIQDAFNSRK